MTDILMISGKQGSGKTTLADLVLKHGISLGYDFFGTEKFAGPLYELHNYLRNKTNDWLQTNPQPSLGQCKAHASILTTYIVNKMAFWTGIRPTVEQDNMLFDFIVELAHSKALVGSVPQKDGGLLQWIGTEYGRKVYGDNVWVDIIIKKIAKLESSVTKRLVVIDDARFTNEFDAFPEAYRVRLYCDETKRKARADAWRDNVNHPSETGLDDYSSKGLFDVAFDTAAQTPEACMHYIFNQLQKQDWKEKRKQ